METFKGQVDALQPQGVSTAVGVDLTVDLVLDAKAGSLRATEELFRRSLAHSRRRAHGRLVAEQRRGLDTQDLAHEVACSALARLDQFEPRHPGSWRAFLCRSIDNRIYDAHRRARRRPALCELSDALPSPGNSPLRAAIEKDNLQRYRRALLGLRPKDRRLIVARVNKGQAYDVIAREVGVPSSGAARVAVGRALQRLAAAVASLSTAPRARESSGALPAGSGERRATQLPAPLRSRRRSRSGSTCSTHD